MIEFKQKIFIVAIGILSGIFIAWIISIFSRGKRNSEMIGQNEAQERWKTLLKLHMKQVGWDCDLDDETTLQFSRIKEGVRSIQSYDKKNGLYLFLADFSRGKRNSEVISRKDVDMGKVEK